MKTLLLSMGILLALGGLIAVSNPKSGVMITSGPDAKRDVAMEVRDEYSKERTRKTGFAAIGLGIMICAVAFFAKGIKVPDPHDTPA